MAEYTEFDTYTPYGIFDGDQHIYEPFDCLTRYLSPEMQQRSIHAGVGPKGEPVMFAGDRLLAMDNQNDECYRPGSLAEMLKTMKKGSGDTGGYQYMKMDPAFVDKDLRITQMDLQKVDAAVMFCGSIGLFLEHFLEDEDVHYESTWAYVKWMFDEWGFDYRNRIFTAPIVSMRNVERSAELLDWLFERGCRVVSMVPGPAYGRSPGDSHFDPIWSRINEARAVVAYHINEAVPGYKSSRSAQWGQDPHPTFYTQSAWQWCWAYGDQPAMETFSSLIYDNVFERFPNLTVLSAEHGLEWAPSFARKMDKMRGMGRNGPWLGGPLTERPSEIFKRHFRLVPYWEDDIRPTVEALGRDIVLGGSDFPHSEGLAFPTQLIEHLETLSPDDQRFIMRDNGMAMLGLS